MDLHADIISRLERGESVYFVYDYEKIAVRCTICNNVLHFYAKFKGMKEYPLKIDIDIVTLALLELHEISGEQYESF